MNNYKEILQRKYLQAVKNLPKIIANEAENISKDAILKEQGWGGVPYPPRQPGAKRPNRPLLIDTTALLRGIYAIPQSENLIYWGNNVRYAKIHNDGGVIHQAARSETFQRKRLTRGINKGKFKKGITKGIQGFTFKERTIVIPQRRFMGNAPFVVQRLTRAAQTYLLKQIS